MCIQTVKKNQVDKHAQRCRSCQAVTCVDCSVTFYGNDYVQHVTCVSEAEKYEKSLYKPKAGKVNPQDAWNALIETATSNAESAPSNVRPYLQRLGELNNVPRNKKKFINFAKNSLKLYSDAILESLWTYLDTYRVDQQKEKNEIKESSTRNTSTPKAAAVAKEDKPSAANSDSEDEHAKKKEKKKLKKEKRKREEEEQQEKVAVEIVVGEDDVNACINEKKDKKKSKKSKKERQE